MKNLFTLGVISILFLWQVNKSVAQNCQIDTFSKWSGLFENYSEGMAGNTKGQVVLRHFGGLSYFNGTAWQKIVKANLPQGMGIAIADNKDIWLSSFYGGLYRLRDTSLTAFDTSNGLPKMQTDALAFGPDGKLYIGINDYGFSVYDGATFKNYDTLDGLCDPYISTIAPDNKGLVYFGSRNGCVSVFNGTTITTLPAIKAGNPEISKLTVDDNGILYALISEYTTGMKFEIYFFNSNTNKWTLIPISLPAETFINDIKAYHEGYLWISTPIGVFKYDGKIWHILATSYGIDTRNIVIDNLNRIWFSKDGVGRLTEKTMISGYCDSVTNGYALLYKMTNGVKKLQKVDSTSINGSGNYIFNNAGTGKHVVYCVSKVLTSPEQIPTYSGNTTVWQDAAVVNAAFCDSTYKMDVKMIRLPVPATGNGYISGTIKSTDGTRAGTQPIKDVDVTLKKVPGGVVKQAKTDVNGFFEFTQVEVGTFIILVDLSGLELDTFRTVIISSTDTTHKNQDYEVDSSGIHAGDFTSIVEKTGNSSINIYPNPSKGQVNIEFTLIDDLHATISIFNMQGALVMNRKSSLQGYHVENFDVSSLPQGIYLIQIQTGESVQQFRLIRN